MLKVSDLRFDYGQRVILENLSLTLDAGALGVLIGLNGAGKSTLLQCIAGWSRPQAGQIFVNDVAIEDERAYRRQVRYVPDTPEFFDELTAWEHLQFIARLSNVNDWQADAEKYLRALHLIDHHDSYPFTFSRGMKLKLAISMALLAAPNLLIMDEPFSPLDPLSVEAVSHLLNDFVGAGHSILLSSHSLPEYITPAYYFALQHGEITPFAADAVTDLKALLADS